MQSYLSSKLLLDLPGCAQELKWDAFTYSSGYTQAWPELFSRGSAAPTLPVSALAESDCPCTYAAIQESYQAVRTLHVSLFQLLTLYLSQEES